MMGMTEQPAPPLNEAMFDVRGPDEQAAAAARRNNKLFMVKVQVRFQGFKSKGEWAALIETLEPPAAPCAV